jgi:hypothetical protein
MVLNIFLTEPSQISVNPLHMHQDVRTFCLNNKINSSLRFSSLALGKITSLFIYDHSLRQTKTKKSPVDQKDRSSLVRGGTIETAHLHNLCLKGHTSFVEHDEDFHKLRLS